MSGVDHDIDKILKLSKTVRKHLGRSLSPGLNRVLGLHRLVGRYSPPGPAQPAARPPCRGGHTSPGTADPG